jgi:acetolactate synthase I/III small subunit
MQHRHTLSILVENKFGVLARIAGLFSGRGFNIDTLNVAPTKDSKFSRMTVVVVGDDKVLDQLIKQLDKLINVIEVQDFHPDEAVLRELVLLQVKADSRTRSEIMQIVDIFRAKIVDVQEDNLLVETTGNQRKVEAFIDMMEKFGIHDMTRTGLVAMKRGTLENSKPKTRRK